MRWNHRVNGKPRVVKEIYLGDMERLARMIEHPLDTVDAYSLSFGVTAAILSTEKEIRLRDCMNQVLGHRGTGISPGDYALIFIMNRLSDPRSKSGIQDWMRTDFASTIYNHVTAQGYWNLMDRISDAHMVMVKGMMRERLISLGYDHSRLFVDGSNLYTYMEENAIAKRGHNKAHRYDLNQVAYYIAANYDYVPFYGDAYPGNMHDSGTFGEILANTPLDAIMIFDRGYNSWQNVELLGKRRYIGALVQSDHEDLMSIPMEADSFAETTKRVYRKVHRIIVYHSSILQRKHTKSFMKHFRKEYAKERCFMESDNSDREERARTFLEAMKLNETIVLPYLKVDRERMLSRFRMFGKNALFTNVVDMDAEEIVDLYRKRNRIEHCFRIISMRDLMSPVYHWTPQKIKVHMFLSYLAYLFLALIYNFAKKIDPRVSMTSVLDALRGVKLQYIIAGKEVRKKLDSRNPEALDIAEKMELVKVA